MNPINLARERPGQVDRVPNGNKAAVSAATAISINRVRFSSNSPSLPEPCKATKSSNIKRRAKSKERIFCQPASQHPVLPGIKTDSFCCEATTTTTLPCLTGEADSWRQVVSGSPPSRFRLHPERAALQRQGTENIGGVLRVSNFYIDCPWMIVAVRAKQ